MILSINYSCKISCIVFLAGLVFLSGCVQTGKTAAFRVSPGKELRVAVLPLDNLSGKTAPLKEIKQSLIDRITLQGVEVLSEKATERFMARYRMRYVGGIDADTAQAFKEEEKVDAVLITSLELYQEGGPPRIGLISRLVSTGSKPVILWMDSIGLTGYDSPGILGLGLIEDSVSLRDKALSLLASSLGEALAGKGKGPNVKGPSTYRPKVFYQAPFIEADKTYTMAALPFFNRSEKRNAGEIVLLHIINALVHQGNFAVLEPGIIRQKFLNIRLIMNEGISLSDADFVANSLNAELILSGKVTDYQDVLLEGGVPKVGFSVSVIEKMSKKIIWASESYNLGNEDVIFFDVGRLNTANTLTSEMARAVAGRMSRRGYQ